jgi:CMP-N-acetylneuraminic acid synthetase
MINVFLPIRKGSERVKFKNTKTFSSIDGGLTKIKLSQLIKVKQIDKIYVSTNDQVVKDLARSFNSSKIIIDNRPDYLGSSEASTDDIINYVPKIISKGVVVWTHVTSPFVDECVYENAITQYLSSNGSYDSLMTVTSLQKFIWKNGESFNYDRALEKWPRTQTLDMLYEVNSGIFIADINIYKKLNDRIGENPFLYEISGKKAFDIDWNDDFEIAEILWAKYGYL